MLDEALINYLANLSKIELNEEAKQRLVTEMGHIVELMDAMHEVQVEGDLSLDGGGVPFEALREDEVQPSYDNEVLIKNAPYHQDQFFVVPKIME